MCVDVSLCDKVCMPVDMKVCASIGMTVCMTVCVCVCVRQCVCVYLAMCVCFWHGEKPVNCGESPGTDRRSCLPCQSEGFPETSLNPIRAKASKPPFCVGVGDKRRSGERGRWEGAWGGGRRGGTGKEDRSTRAERGVWEGGGGGGALREAGEDREREGAGVGRRMRQEEVLSGCGRRAGQILLLQLQVSLSKTNPLSWCRGLTLYYTLHDMSVHTDQLGKPLRLIIHVLM